MLDKEDWNLLGKTAILTVAVIVSFGVGIALAILPVKLVVWLF